MKALVISADPQVREALKLTLQSVERRSGRPWEYLEAADGIAGMRVAWRELPEIVLTDEITSRAGAFAVAKELTGAMQPFPGAVVILLARSQDRWLAEWSGAEAWVERPLDPFALADTVLELVERRNRQEAG